MIDWWVGGYGADMGGTAQGVGLLRQRPDGSLGFAGVAAVAESPSFLLRAGDLLHAATEGEAMVRSFDAATLVPAGSAPTGGTLPCHLTAVGSAVIVANYGDGSLGVIADSTLVQSIAGAGSGPRAEQVGPHAHSSLLLDSTTLVSADLGADRLHLHDIADGVLTRVSSLAVPPGTGPRDLALLRPGALLVLGEFSCELLVLERSDGGLVVRASVPLPGRQPGDQAAAIASHGDYLYVGLRGSNRIAVLRSGPAGVQPVGWVGCAGDWPRHLAAADGVLHVANQISGSVASFRLGDDGVPVLIRDPEPVPTPTHLLPVG